MIDIQGGVPVTIQQMKYLMAIVYAGSISEAAKQLYVAQSSVSASMRELENEFGFEIFTRGSRGVSLTRKGENLAVDVKTILEKIESLDSKFKKRNEQHNSFSVATQHHLPGIDAFCQFIQAATGAPYNFAYLEMKTSDVLHAVSNGLADIGIMFLASSAKDLMIQRIRKLGLVFNNIAYKPVHIYLHESHPLAAHPMIYPEELNDYPFITYDLAVDNDSAFTDILNYTQKQVVHVTDRAAAYTLLRDIHGYLSGSGFPTKDEKKNGIRVVPLCGGETWEIGWLSKVNIAENEMTPVFLRYLIDRFDADDKSQNKLNQDPNYRLR